MVLFIFLMYKKLEFERVTVEEIAEQGRINDNKPGGKLRCRRQRKLLITESSVERLRTDEPILAKQGATTVDLRWDLGE